MAKRLVQTLTQAGITNQRVLEVIQTTPRERFMPESLAHKAYENTALPIGNGQTISQILLVNIHTIKIQMNVRLLVCYTISMTN